MCAFTTVVEKSWAHENYFLYSTTHFVEVAQKYNVKYAQTSSFNKKKTILKKVDLLSNDKMGKMLSRIFQSGHVVLIENVQSVSRLFYFYESLKKEGI